MPENPVDNGKGEDYKASVLLQAELPAAQPDGIRPSGNSQHGGIMPSPFGINGLSPDTSVLRVKNWWKFQRYKDRRPPWIKLYSSTLDDYAFTNLTLEQRGFLVGLWTLASRFGGLIPDDLDWIARELGLSRCTLGRYFRTREKSLLDSLVHLGWFSRAQLSMAVKELEAEWCARRVHGATKLQNRGQRTEDRKDNPPTPLKVSSESQPATSQVLEQPLPSSPSGEPLLEKFIADYPSHRMNGHVGKVTQLWLSIAPSPGDAAGILARLSSWKASVEWRKNQGQYVPRPEKFLTDARYRSAPSENHMAETIEIRAFYLQFSNQPNSVNLLTPEREQMLSHRYDDALRMAKGNDPRVAMELVRGAIQACFNSSRFKKHPDRVTLETIFGSTEKLERWVKEYTSCSD